MGEFLFDVKGCVAGLNTVQEFISVRYEKPQQSLVGVPPVQYVPYLWNPAEVVSYAVLKSCIK
jgi:hypothetical protein